MKIRFPFENFLLLVLIVFSYPLFGGCESAAPSDRLYSAPNSLLREYDFTSNGLVKIHDYGYGSLFQLGQK